MSGDVIQLDSLLVDGFPNLETLVGDKIHVPSPWNPLGPDPNNPFIVYGADDGGLLY